MLLFSCSHAPKRRVEIKGSYQENKASLKLQNSFAFMHNGHEYYFASKVDRESGFDCEFYIGFLDGKFEYSFPVSRMSEFEEHHSTAPSPEQRLRTVVSHLEEFKRNDFLYLCSDNFNTSTVSGTEAKAYSPLLIFLGPSTDQKDLSHHIEPLILNLDDLRLGMSFKEVTKVAQERKQNGYVLYVFDKENTRVVMYFKNHKLFAWARGKK
jgi:hypothetical protein